MPDETKSDKRIPRRRSVTRERLLAAATASFLEKGFHDSSIEAIAAAAGYTSGAFYSNFKDKDSLFLAVADARFEEYYVNRFPEIEKAETAADLATMLAKIPAGRDETYLQWGSASLEFAAYSMRNPKVYEQLRASLRRSLALLEEALAHMAEQCDIPAPKFAELVLAVLNGTFVLRLSDDAIDEPGLATLILSRILSSAPAPGEERS